MRFMNNTYLLNKGFYIKEDLSSFLFYFDHFSQGLTLPKYLGHRMMRKFAHVVLRQLIIVMYLSKIYKFKYEIVRRKDSAIIIITGKGKWGNTLRVVERNGGYKIIKKTFDKKKFEKEKKFYTLYKTNHSRIKLPQHTFLSKNTIEMEFVKAKNFQRLIADGTISFGEALNEYEKIKESMRQLYGTENTLVHGDLWPGNIFIDGNTYYLIDYSDSHMSNLNYDLYVLLYSILASYYYITDKEKTIANYSFQNVSMANLIETDNKNLLKLEKQFIDYREARFPGVYY